MKLSSNIILVSLLATGAEAFGVQRGQVSMRVGHYDMVRRQKFNNILSKVDESPTKEMVTTVLLAPETNDLIQKCNWKLRRMMIRKVKEIAEANGAEIDGSFGVPPSQPEKELLDQAGKVERIAARAAQKKADDEAAKARAETKAKNKSIRIEKMKESLARAAEAKKNAAPEPVAVVEPEPVAIAEPEPVAATKPEPVTVVAAPAAAAASGDITPKRIKELRDATGAGMMDCKKALIDSDGDMEAATEILRTKGLAKADKKASRIAAEGKIAGAAAGDKAVLVEINCETDFVAKDSSFMDFTKSVANAALSVQGDDVEGLLAAGIDGTTVEESRQALVSKIGENIQVRRLVGRGGSGTTVGAYVHMNRIGVLVEIEGGTTQLAEDVAMHVAAMNPPFAVPGDVSQEVLDKERAFLTQQALDSGKPKEIVDKMVEGRIRKYLEEICLVSQTYVKTNDKTVGKLLEENGAKMVGFTRIEVGEGIEKRQDDFAAEVAKMAAGGV